MDTATAEIGHNQPTPFEALEARKEELLSAVDRMPELDNQVTADKANEFLAQLRSFGKAAEAERKAEKQPLDEQTREIQSRYKALTGPVEAATKLVKDKLSAYLRKQEQKRLEAEKRQREEADKLKREAEEAATKAAQADSNSDAINLATAAEARHKEAARVEAEADATAKTTSQVHGNFGSATSLRTVWSAKITDYDQALATLKDNDDVRAAVEKAANQLARSPASRKMTFPGIEFVSEQKV